MASCEGPAASCLLVLVGLPASGKSTLAQALIDTKQPFEHPVVVTVVSFDKFLEVEMQAAGTATQFSQEVWQASRAKALDHARTLLQQPTITVHDPELPSQAQCNLQGVDTQGQLLPKACGRRYRLVVLDDNMQLTSMRYNCWQMSRKCGAAYAQVYLDCPLDLARTRNAGRLGAARVSEHVLERMAATLCQPPNAGQPYMQATSSGSGQPHMQATTSGSSGSGTDGGWLPGPSLRQWENNTLHVLAGHTNVTATVQAQRVWQWLLHAWGAPSPAPLDHELALERRLQGQQANAYNLVHVVDLESRRMVSECMQRLPRECKQAAAARLHAARQQLLDSARALVKAHERGCAGAQQGSAGEHTHACAGAHEQGSAGADEGSAGGHEHACAGAHWATDKAECNTQSNTQMPIIPRQCTDAPGLSSETRMHAAGAVIAHEVPLDCREKDKTPQDLPLPSTPQLASTEQVALIKSNVAAGISDPLSGFHLGPDHSAHQEMMWLATEGAGTLNQQARQLLLGFAEQCIVSHHSYV